MSGSKPTGMPRTDRLFHELSVPRYGESPSRRSERMEAALFRLCIQLERELTGLPLTPLGVALSKE